AAAGERGDAELAPRTDRHRSRRRVRSQGRGDRRRRHGFGSGLSRDELALPGRERGRDDPRPSPEHRRPRLQSGRRGEIIVAGLGDADPAVMSERAFRRTILGLPWVWSLLFFLLPLAVIVKISFATSLVG